MQTIQESINEKGIRHAEHLYQHLLDTYKEHRKMHSLADDDELYKWQLIDEAQGKNDIDQVLFLLNHPHNNLMSWRQIDFFKKYICGQPEKANQIFANLYDEEKDIKDRVKSFLNIQESGFTTDERSASVFLACHTPAKYLLYKDSYYQKLCKYLGVKAQPAGQKYEHYTSLMRPLVKLIEGDAELKQIIATEINTLVNSPLLIAQDIVYKLFDHNIINTEVKNMFDWIPFYEELATKLLTYKDRRKELAKLIYSRLDRENDIKFLHDGDGSDFTELDPFTVYSIITRNMKKRTDLAQKMKGIFDMAAPTPQSFEGLPVQNPMNAAFICFTEDRSADGKDVDRLWTLFESALNDGDLEETFNAVLKQKSIAIRKLTMGLYYISPNKYLALDDNNRKYLEQYGISTTNFKTWKYADYQNLLQTVMDKMSNKDIAEQTIPEFSANAYGHENIEVNDEECEYYQELADLLRFKKNIIIEGAPGVGKTYELYRIITRLCQPELKYASDATLRHVFDKLKAERRVEYVTFHQSFDYEEFVEGLHPLTNEAGNISYEIKSGIFKQICEEAHKNDQPYILVIDEINRGNVSKIFGDLITLLEPDKRAGMKNQVKVRLPYSGESFAIPGNLYIIGTMNTADRSLDPLDYAMRRRFAIVKFKPICLEAEGFNDTLFKMVSELFIKNFADYDEDYNITIEPSDCLAEDIKPEDVWIGHSYFIMQDEQMGDVTRMRIQYEIIPLLEEYIKDGVFKDSNTPKEVIKKLNEYEVNDTDY